MIRTHKGFTLIELLVVIAIIGILSAVVLASLNTARSRGVEASVKSNLNNSRAQAELFYSENGSSYNNVCASAPAGNVKSIYGNMQAAATASGMTGGTFIRNGIGTKTVSVCNDSADAWAVQVPYLLVGTVAWFYCADSTGYATSTYGTKIGAATDYLCSS